MKNKKDKAMKQFTIFKDLLIVLGKNGKYGVRDKWGNVKQRCVFDHIVPDSNGYLRTYKDDLRGIASGITGETLVSCRWQKVKPFDDYYFMVSDKSGKWGVVNNDDRQELPCEWEEIQNSTDNYYLVKGENGKWGVATSGGRVVIDCRWVDLCFEYYYYKVKGSDGKYGLYDTDGKEILAAKWNDLKLEFDAISVQADNGLWGIIDCGRHILSECTRDRVDYEYIPGDCHTISECKWRSVDYESLSNTFLVTDSNDKIGIMDADGKLVEPCRWNKIKSLKDRLGFAVVDDSGLYGFLNKDMKQTIPCQWTSMMSGVGGLIVCNSEGVYGILRTDGSEIVPCCWKLIRPHYEPYYAVQASNGLWGVLDIDGKQILDAQWKDIEIGKLIRIQSEQGKWGVADTKGTIILEPKWEWLSISGDGIIKVAKNNRMGAYTIEGTMITKCMWNDIAVDRKGFSIKCDLWDIPLIADIPYKGKILVQNSEGLWGVIGSDGQDIIPCKWEGLIESNDRKMYFVRENELWGLIDGEGKTVLPCQWQWIGNLFNYEEYFKVCDTQNLVGVVDINGNEIVPCKYCEFIQYGDDGEKAIVRRRDGAYGILDSNWQEVVPCEWLSIDSLIVSWNPVIVENLEHKWGVLEVGEWGNGNTGYKMLIPAEWRRVTANDSETAFYVMNDDGLWGAIDFNGKMIVEPTFEFKSELEEWFKSKNKKTK